MAGWSRRAVQGAGLTLLIGPLAWSQFGLGSSPWAAEFMGRLDPLAALVTAVADRAATWALFPGCALLALTPLFGRAFCGWLCPLGATIDAADAILGRHKNNRQPKTSLGRQPSSHRNVGGHVTVWLTSPAFTWAPYGLLAVLIAAALVGVSLLHLAAPLSLAGRLYGVVALPLMAKATRWAMDSGRPLLEALDLRALLFAEFKSGIPNTALWSAGIGLLLLAASRITPRWWCRSLCPAGALMALPSLIRPAVWSRKVSQACIHCMRCQQACPMQAIEDDPADTRHSRCIMCRSCAMVCPVGAVVFSPAGARDKAAACNPHLAGPAAAQNHAELAENAHAPVISRRTLIAGTAGLAAGAVLRSDSATSAPEKQPLRPPGSVPEDHFLSRCTRCGLCVAACPTQILQPLYVRYGLDAALSPAILPTKGFCDPRCHACGHACPTDAITPLDARERIWAKMGTATVIRKRCLAWELRKKCLVCDETCPYDAIDLKPEPGNPVHVPHVNENRCAGCGYCQRHCPVEGPKAIEVEPRGAIRLVSGSRQTAAKARGLDLDLRPQPKHQDGPAEPDAGGLPPGFSE